MFAVDGTFVATVFLAAAAATGIVVSIFAASTSLNSQRDALRASVRPIIVEGIEGRARIVPDDNFLELPIRNVGPGVAAVCDVKIGQPGSESTGFCDQQVIPHDVTYHFPKVSGGPFDPKIEDASVLIRYQGIGNERFETALELHAFDYESLTVVQVRVYLCKKNWARIEPPFIRTDLR